MGLEGRARSAEMLPEAFHEGRQRLCRYSGIALPLDLGSTLAERASPEIPSTRFERVRGADDRGAVFIRCPLLRRAHPIPPLGNEQVDQLNEEMATEARRETIEMRSIDGVNHRVCQRRKIAVVSVGTMV
jgi:hypothetical protein